MKKFIYLITFSLFLFQNIFSQTEFNYSADGYKWGDTLNNKVNLAIYIAVNNLGSLGVEPSFKNIVLTSSNYSSEKDILLLNARLIIGEINQESIYRLYQLDYLVPINAENLKLIIADYSTKKEITITNGYRKDKVEKTNYGNSNESNPQNKTYGQKALTIPYFGLAAFGGYGINQNKLGNQQNGWNIGFSIFPKLFVFGKKDRFVVYSNLNVTYNRLLAPGSFESKNREYYEISEDEYRIIDEGTPYSEMLSWLAGVGLYYKTGKINPLFSISIGSFSLNLKHVAFFNRMDGMRSKDIFASQIGFQIDFGVHIANLLYLGYSFERFNVNSKFSLINGNYNNQKFKIGLMGWSK